MTSKTSLDEPVEVQVQKPHLKTWQIIGLVIGGLVAIPVMFYGACFGYALVTGYRTTDGGSSEDACMQEADAAYDAMTYWQQQDKTYMNDPYGAALDQCRYETQMGMR